MKRLFDLGLSLMAATVMLVPAAPRFLVRHPNFVAYLFEGGAARWSFTLMAKSLLLVVGAGAMVVLWRKRLNCLVTSR